MMKIALLTLSVLFATASTYAAEPISLRVLSYNIHHGEGVDGSLDLPRIASVIRSVEPDLVALQEVDQKVNRSGDVDQPAELARLTDMHVVFGGNIELQGGHYGNAILSRFPITKFSNHPLPNVDEGEPRGVMMATISAPKLDSSLRLLATHLDHRRSDVARVQSAKFINGLVKSDSSPAVLMGDMNDVIGSATISRFDQVWKRTNEKPMPTIPVGQPTRQIDFILFHPAERWQVVETQVLDEAVASDHRAIFSVLELRSE
ncbi:endonuclease/exonuclease/phosphatase family protein [Allorhodopirellula heiligendammensis]|nr:endonuclease/exonuclease/phosphatase family protein [Allorhodopirellula heiligendammensis]